MELFYYSLDTGKLLNRKTRHYNAVAGDEAGYKKRRGYREVSVDGNRFYSHRAIWLMVYGEDPGELEVDHIDGDTTNNRIENLRVVAGYENRKNMKVSCNNRSGVVGVYWDSERGMWCSQIKVGGKTKFLGRFDNKEDAIHARKQAETRYGFHPNHGRLM